mgnify:CR=1 FL=1
MATTFTVGGIDLGRSSLQKWASDGQTARISGTIRESTFGGFAAAVYQVKGLLRNPDERFGVPVIPSSDPSLTGFYRVTGGDIEVIPAGMRSFWANYTLELGAVPGRASPQIESRLLGALRTNSHSIVVGSTVPWWATPTDATMDYVPGATVQTRTGDGGSVKVQYTTDGTLFLDSTRTMQCAAADYYDMSARIESSDGTSWRVLKGREAGSVVPAVAGWRLTNDLVRVMYGGGDGLLSVTHYSPAASAWQNEKVYKLTRGATTPTALGPFRTISILRNSPECVILRLGVEQDSTTYPAQINVDLCLRRGAMWVDVTVVRAPGQVSSAESASLDFPLGVVRNTTEAGTSHTSGVHATSADAGAGGGKYVLTSPTATNVDTTNGGIRQGTGVNTFQFMAGYEPASASGADTFTNQVYAYFAAVDEVMRPTRR